MNTLYEHVGPCISLQQFIYIYIIPCLYHNHGLQKNYDLDI